MKSYELTYLVSPEALREKIRTLQEKINAFVQEQSGILGESHNPIRKNLGYPIKDKKEACLLSSNFQMSPEKLSDFEKKLKAETQILRYIILAKQAKKEKARAPLRKPARKKPVVPSEKKVPKEKKVEIQELDKKLEEILKE